MFYGYFPIYGVEPFQNNAKVPLTGSFSSFGGGAELTSQNLLVTLWALPGPTPFPPVAGQLLQPMYVNETESGVINGVNLRQYNKSFLPMTYSRTACKFLFQTGSQDPLVTPLLGILNPPGELKNLYQNYCKAYLNNMSTLTVETLRSQFDYQAWEARTVNTSIFNTDTPCQSAFGGLGFAPLPLVKTSGADGVFPEFYTNLAYTLATPDPARFIADVKSIADGNFYVPVIFGPEDPSAFAWSAEINWPHSIAR